MWLVSLFLLYILQYIGINKYGIQINFWYVGVCMVTGVLYQEFCNWLADKI
jgi:hypothetical protein